MGMTHAAARFLACWLLLGLDGTGAAASEQLAPSVNCGNGLAQQDQGLATPPTLDPPEVGEMIRNVEALEKEGKLEQAALISAQILATRRNALGSGNPEVAASLSNLASLHLKQGRYRIAEDLFNQARIIYECVSGKAHLDTGVVLNNLAGLYERQGRYSMAEQIYLSVLESLRKSLGEDHHFVATLSNNLGMLYYLQGRPDEAEPLIHSALGIRERLTDRSKQKLATSLSNLALIYQAQKRHTAAEALFLRALSIREKEQGLEHRDTAGAINNLASLYKVVGRYSESERLYQRALAIRRSTLGAEHPLLANSLNNLAMVYWEQGQLEKAEPLFKQTLEMRQKLLPIAHPDTADSLSNLAVLNLQQGQFASARLLLSRLNESQGEWLRRELPLQPRDLRTRLLGQQPNVVGVTFATLHRDKESMYMALEARLNRQGLLAEIERRQRQLSLSSPESRDLAERLAGIDRQLASVNLPIARQLPLLQQRQSLEAQLYRLLPALRIEPVSTAQVATALKTVAPQGMLVELQKFRPFVKDPRGKGTLGSDRYLALLLKPDGNVRAIPLGEASPIDEAVSKAVGASADPARQVEASQRLAQVSELVLRPLQGDLKGVRELFLSPDGELNRLPFGALPVATVNGPTLGESLQLRLLTTGRDLLRLQQPMKVRRPAVLIANPDFNAAVTAPRSPQQLQGRGTASGSHQRLGGVRNLIPWPSLDGTAREGEILAPLLRPPSVVSGRQATAAMVLRLKAPRILHIATHGFFLADQPLQNDAPRAEDPLQRSGLVFAGANHPDANPVDDGYLTAAEATAMDLEGTELVTLSACETALGGVRSGEGVYGLQRSLAVAGARSTLLSLWKVDDVLTVTFMEEYYKRLRAGEGRADALRNTQAWFRSNKDSTLRDVRVWGAFQLSGDWRPVQGW
jgi:CHAT domain-containing protein/Flp pilus assembly protein TadD